MKITYSGNNIDITMSQTEWESIGKKAIDRKAMAVPMTEEHARNMARDGIYALLNLRDVESPMPQANKTDIETILQDHGIVTLFNEAHAINVLQLPKILVPGNANYVEIEGRQYVLAHVEPSKDPKKSDPKRGLVKGVHQDGVIICLDIQTGMPAVFSYDQYSTKVKVSSDRRMRNMEDVNKAIRAYNHRIDEIDKALGVEKLPLQMSSVEDAVNERISDLQRQLEWLQRKEQDPVGSSESYKQWIDFLREGIRNNRFELRDTFDTLIFLYKMTPSELVQGLAANPPTIAVPTELRGALIAIAEQEQAAGAEAQEKMRTKTREKTERMEEPLPPEKEHEGRIREFNLEDMPETKHRTSSQYQTLESWSKSLTAQRIGIESNMNELVALKATFASAREYIGALKKGQRGVSFLSSPEGSVIVADLRTFLDRSESFLKRYAVDVVKNGAINPALLGRAGQLGNSLIAVALLKIYNVIKGDLARVESHAEPSERVPAETNGTPETVGTSEINGTSETSPMTPVAGFKGKFSKLSEALWSLTFEKRQRIR